MQPWASRRQFLQQALQSTAILTAASSLGGVPLFAEEQPKPAWEMTKPVSLGGLEISISKPRLVARSHGYLWFPTMTRLSGASCAPTSPRISTLSSVIVIYGRIPHGWQAIPQESRDNNSIWVVKLAWKVR